MEPCCRSHVQTSTKNIINVLFRKWSNMVPNMEHIKEFTSIINLVVSLHKYHSSKYYIIKFPHVSFNVGSYKLCCYS